MRKLVVFDLDQTLVDSKYAPLLDGEGTPINVEDITLFVYLRPHAQIVLEICRAEPELSIVLFSAGNTDYVNSVVEHVLLPSLNRSFYFDAIYSKEDLDAVGIKRMDILKDKFQVEDVLLVDDSEHQCLWGAALYKLSWFCIKPFEDPEDYGDISLLEVLKHPFFYTFT